MIIIVPARIGSKRVPRKNLQVVGGKTLVRHALDLLYEHAPKGVRCILSTDDNDIANEAAGAWCPVRMRHPSAATDDAPMYKVIEDLGAHQDEWAMVVQPCNPFLSKQTLLLASVAPGYCEPMVSVDEEGKRNGIYVAKVSRWLDGKGLTPQEMWGGALQIRHKGPSVDINTPEDLARARALWAELYGES